MKTFSTACIVSLSFAVFASACGGANVSESAFDEPAGDAAVSTDTGTTPTTETGGKDTGGTVVEDTAKPDTPPPVTADNLCTKLADAVCTSALSSCCATRGIGYNETGCRTAITAGCAAELESVKAGKTTLDLGAFSACTSAWSTLATKCSTPILDFLKTYPACNQLFNGTTPFGGACTKDYQCKVAAGAYASCTGEGRCDSIAVVGNGAACGNTGSTRAYCDYGFYCAYTSSTSGTCRPAKPMGTPCTTSNECGIGNYCARSGSAYTCAVGLAAGASCSVDQQCASGDCGTTGRCTDPNVSVASPGVCNGAGG